MWLQDFIHTGCNEGLNLLPKGLYLNEYGTDFTVSCLKLQGSKKNSNQQLKIALCELKTDENGACSMLWSRGYFILVVIKKSIFV